MGQVRKLFNAVKRLVKGIIKPCLKQKLEAPQYEYVVQELVHVQTTTYTADECPAYSEVDLIRQRQQAQYGNVFQAPPPRYTTYFTSLNMSDLC